MRKFVFVAIVSFVFFGTGCAPLDNLVGYNYETGQVSEESALKDAQEAARGFGPWGEIAALVLGVTGGGYLLVRKIQKKIKDKK